MAYMLCAAAMRLRDRAVPVAMARGVVRQRFRQRTSLKPLVAPMPSVTNRRSP